MAVSAFTDLRGDLRRAIRDDYATLWSDTALDSIINEAQREYALYAGTLTGRTRTIVTGESAAMAAPADFIQPIRFNSPDGCEIPIVSWRMLSRGSDFRKDTGRSIESVCFDYDGYGSFRFYPRVPAGLEAGVLTYARLPRRDVIETPNREAVRLHCLYQMFFLTQKEASMSYYRRFVSEVDREARSMSTLNVQRMGHGRFF